LLDYTFFFPVIGIFFHITEKNFGRIILSILWFFFFTLQPIFRILHFATWVKADFENQRNDNNTPTYIKALKVTITTQLILSLFMLTSPNPQSFSHHESPPEISLKVIQKSQLFFSLTHKQSPNERNKVNSIF